MVNTKNDSHMQKHPNGRWRTRIFVKTTNLRFNELCRHFKVSSLVVINCSGFPLALRITSGHFPTFPLDTKKVKVKTFIDLHLICAVIHDLWAFRSDFFEVIVFLKILAGSLFASSTCLDTFLPDFFCSSSRARTLPPVEQLKGFWRWESSSLWDTTHRIAEETLETSF